MFGLFLFILLNPHIAYFAGRHNKDRGCEFRQVLAQDGLTMDVSCSCGYEKTFLFFNYRIIGMIATIEENRKKNK